MTRNGVGEQAGQVARACLAARTPKPLRLLHLRERVTIEQGPPRAGFACPLLKLDRAAPTGGSRLERGAGSAKAAALVVATRPFVPHGAQAVSTSRSRSPSSTAFRSCRSILPMRNLTLELGELVYGHRSAQHDALMCIDSMQLNHTLRKINTQSEDLFHGCLAP